MSVKRGQDRLLRIADYLDRTEFTPRQELVSAEFSWLANALRNIAKGGGVDIANALGVKAKRGERTNSSQRKKISYRDQHISGFIYKAMQPLESGGLGLTLEQTCFMAGEAFGLSDETIKTYWNNRPEVRERLKACGGVYTLED